jgi:hypothetical protein
MELSEIKNACFKLHTPCAPQCVLHSLALNWPQQAIDLKDKS